MYTTFKIHWVWRAVFSFSLFCFVLCCFVIYVCFCLFVCLFVCFLFFVCLFLVVGCSSLVCFDSSLAFKPQYACTLTGRKIDNTEICFIRWFFAMLYNRWSAQLFSVETIEISCLALCARHGEKEVTLYTDRDGTPRKRTWCSRCYRSVKYAI